MRENHLNVQHTKLENKLIDSLANDGYNLWGINIEANSFPPYTKQISAKLDDDTFINISIATDNLKTITRMIKEEMDLLRLLGFSVKNKTFRYLTGYAPLRGSSKPSVIILDDLIENQG